MEKVRLTPRDFFLHLGIIVSLYVSIVSLISLLFQVIDYTVGDNISFYYDFYSSGLRTAIASLVIFFPVYLILGWIFKNDLKTSPEKHALGVRRWFIYFTLFAAGLTIVIDLVVLLNNFLGGETTTGFFYKVLVVFVVAGLTFVYYMLDLRRGAEKHARLYRIFAIAALFIVVASVVVAFTVVGSPMSQREKRFDQIRVNNIQTLQSDIINYWNLNDKKLPASTANLVGELYPESQLPADPKTGAAYEYRIISPLSFELCATFSRSNKEDFNRAKDFSNYPSGIREWLHDSGRVCFTKKINPAEYQNKPAAPTRPVVN